MKTHAILFALGVSMASHCLAEDDSRSGEVKLTILEPKRKIFVPGEPVTVGVKLTNGSKSPIIRPARSAWQLSVEDFEGRFLQDIDSDLHGEAYYDPAKPGGKIAVAKILPGQSKSWRWDLRLRFEIVIPGRYTFGCGLGGAFVPWDEKIDPRSIKQSDRFAIQAKPLEFVVSEAPIFWKEQRTLFVSPMITRRVITEIVFQAAELQKERTLSFYLAGRHRRGDRYWGFQQIGKLKSKDIPPQMKEYGGRRFGIRYLSPDGRKCVFIVYNGSRKDWVHVDLADDHDWPKWPDEEAWRKLKHPTPEEPREDGGPLAPDCHNRDQGP
ncbi:hypothetical protein HQ563_12755 [bacterium]|nr:hypothetical protein [bacterium]